MRQVLPSKSLPSVPWQARHADSDYGVSDEPDWRQVDWASHLHRAEVGQDSLTYGAAEERETVDAASERR